MNLSLTLEKKKKKRLKLLKMLINHHLQVLIDMYLNFKVVTVEQFEVIEIMFIPINERELYPDGFENPENRDALTIIDDVDQIEDTVSRVTHLTLKKF
jgi:hypothetical protein